jgi:ATP-dependent Clp protease adapter protein ClpS
MSLTEAVKIMWRIHVTGAWEVGVFAAQWEAEELAARLQVSGLHGAVREAR